MIGLLHGYLLDGSGSNLWTRSIVKSLCRSGQTVHLFCQERRPADYDFVAEAWVRDAHSEERLFQRAVDYPGRCVLHRPEIGGILPVYVWDQYEGFQEVVPMVELTDAQIEAYIDRNVVVVDRVVRSAGISALHANHAVLMSVVAERVARSTGLPYTVMPHGSAIEYAVKKDERFLRYAVDAFRAASRIFVIGDEMRRRLDSVFGPHIPDLEMRVRELNLGVDTSEFRLVSREERARSIEHIPELIATLPRGKTPGQSAELAARIHREMPFPQMHRLMADTADYTGKAPDADLEERLHHVDWRRDPILLFVGRLIAAKGAQAIIVALPEILRVRPDSRLILVGHGPLREPLEALVWALHRGDRDLALHIAAWGRGLEDAAEGEAAADAEPEPLVEVQAFFDALRRDSGLDDYFERAGRLLRPETVLFTGYLKHDELRHLFPCCDVAIFPSLVAEAGPLVFLEALASGCFPLGTYFAGMAASIDAVAEALPAGEADWMKLSPDRATVAADIARRVPGALERADAHRDTLRRVAVEQYDWSSVAAKLSTMLETLSP
ncbi:MAG: glycosyltransferase [Longimicrobiales bacterium]